MGYSNPVENFGSLIDWKILSYEGTHNNSTVLLVKQGKKIISITSDMILNLIRDGVEVIGKTKLGIFLSEIGTHLIRSNAAMAMYLAGVPIFMNRTEQLRKLGKLQCYYLDQFNQKESSYAASNGCKTALQLEPRSGGSLPPGFVFLGNVQVT
jgi:hypothetical protein